MISYKGVFRTTLDEEERSLFNEIASSKGMTTTGLHDLVIRELLSREKGKEVEKIKRPPTLINMRELAEVLGLKYQTVQTSVKRGQWGKLPPPIRVGKSYRWNLEEVVLPWIKNRQKEEQ